MNKYITEAFDIGSEYFKKMINIFSQEKVGDLYIHHIVPRCFFKRKKIECDNSEDNLIPLTYKQHILVHFYAYKCSREIIKEDMLNAIQLLLNSRDIEIAEEQIKDFSISDERSKFFFQKVKAKYDNQFEYKSKYINAKTKILIHCNICNSDFYQLPDNHLKYGCPVCAKRYTPTFEQMVEKANLIHNNFYSYDKSTYKSMDEKMKIICPVHGEFWQKPLMHINRKEGCPQCRYISSSKKQRKDTNYFIKRAIEMYGDKFDYSKVNYINYNTKVIIICKTCGNEFQRTPNHFFGGRLCPYCKKTKK